MSKINRRTLLKGAGIGGAALVVAPTIIVKPARADTIRVGGLHDRTGPIGIYGNEMADALVFAVEEINAAGGVLGQQLELVEYDAQSTMANYSQYAQRLSTSDKVDVIFGGITSASRESIRPVFDRFRKLYFYSTFYEGGVCDRTVFCNAETPAQINGPLLQYAMNKFGAKTVYTIAADYIYGQITADWIKKYAKDFGGEVIAEEFFPLDVGDFASTITKIQQAAPDLVVSALVGGNHIGFYRQWPAAGMQDKIPVASTVFGPWENAFVSAEEAEGIMCSYHYFQSIDTPANAAFLEKWRGRYGADASGDRHARGLHLQLGQHVEEGRGDGRHHRAHGGDRGAGDRDLRRGAGWHGDDGSADPPHDHERGDRRAPGRQFRHRRGRREPASGRHRYGLRPDQQSGSGDTVPDQGRLTLT